MRHASEQRVKKAFIGSAFTIGAGVYCLFLQMGTYNFVPLAIGLVMLAGANMLRDITKQRTGGVLVLFGVVLLFSSFNTMINTMVSSFDLNLGSERLNFGIIDRLIVTVLLVIGGTLGLIGGMDGILEKDEFLSLLRKWRVPEITMLLNGFLTAFIILWIPFYIAITRHPLESIMFFPLAAGALVGFFLGWWAINRRKSIGIAWLGNLLCALLFGFLSLFEFIYLPLCMLSILSNGALVSMTGQDITFWPRYTKRNKIFETATIPLAIAAVLIIPVPFLIGTWPAVTITVPAGLQQDVMEINWAIGSEQTTDFDWYTRNETIDMIQAINNNSATLGLNISVTVPLVREVFNSSFADILKALYANNITFDLMPIVDSSQFGLSDEYIHDESIHKFGKIYSEMRDWLHDEGIINKNTGFKMYRALVVDLERTQQISGSINGLIMGYMSGPARHVLGSNELLRLMNEFKANGEDVAGAFFDFHIYDFFDWDDAQQEFFKISIVPPTDWEFMASMIYQSGPGSNMSVLGYANQMNYHFGDRAVPYIVTMNSDYADILTRFRILKNTGFSKVGAWAMHELFFNGSLFGVNRAHKDASGNNDTWNATRFIQLHHDLAQDVDVSFQFTGFHSENTYYQLTLLLDAWLVRRPVYLSWPIMGQRIPNLQFETWTALAILAYVMVAFFTVYIAWNPFGKKKARALTTQ